MNIRGSLNLGNKISRRSRQYQFAQSLRRCGSSRLKEPVTDGVAQRGGVMSILSFCSAVVSRIRRHTRTRCGSVAVWCTVVHMGGWTSVVGCRAVMLLGPCLPSFSLIHNLSAFVLLSVVSFHPLSFVSLLPPSQIVPLALAALYLSLSLSLSPFPFSSSRRTRGPRVSRQALWWLLRWLLASLESSQESVPPRGSRNSLGNRFTSFFASLHPSFSLLPPFSRCAAQRCQPALCPLRFVP